MKHIKLFEELNRRDNVNYGHKVPTWEDVPTTEWDADFAQVDRLPAWQVWAINPQMSDAYKEIDVLDKFEVKPNEEEFIVSLGPKWYMIHAEGYDYARRITELTNLPEELQFEED